MVSNSNVPRVSLSFYEAALYLELYAFANIRRVSEALADDEFFPNGDLLSDEMASQTQCLFVGEACHLPTKIDSTSVRHGIADSMKRTTHARVAQTV